MPRSTLVAVVHGSKCESGESHVPSEPAARALPTGARSSTHRCSPTALLDRLLHHATTLNIKGESFLLRKAEIAAEERRKEAERRRLERERLERLEKARVGRLLAQAKSLREAEEIRAYVSAVRERQAALDDPLSATGFQQWADWALSQADRIDPVLSGSFRTVQDDD